MHKGGAKSELNKLGAVKDCAVGIEANGNANAKGKREVVERRQSAMSKGNRRRYSNDRQCNSNQKGSSAASGNGLTG